MSTDEKIPFPPQSAPTQDGFLATFIESIEDGLLGLDRDWRFIFINSKAAHNIGYERDQLIGKNIWETFPAIQGTDHEVYYRQVMEQRQFAHFELNGVLTQQSYDIRIYPSNDGIIVYWVDITQRKQVEMELVKANQLAEHNQLILEAVMQQLPAGVIITDASGLQAKNNLEMDRIWKRDMLPDENIEAHAYRAFHADGREYELDEWPLTRALKNGEHIVGEEMTILRGDGSTGVVHCSAAPIRGADGEIMAGVVIDVDITHQKQVEENFKESERRYRELVKYAPAAIYEIDFLNRRFISVNDAMCEMSGFTREELLQMDASAILDEDSQHLFRQRILEVQSGLKPTENVEYKVRAKDGHEIFASLNTTFKTDEKGRILRATVIGHDVTQRKRNELAIQKANETLQRQAEELEAQTEELQSQANELRLANEKLHKNELRLRNFFESTHDYFLSLDQDWRIAYANTGFSKIMGFTAPENLIGSNFWQKFSRYLDTPVEKNYRQAMEKRTPTHFEVKGLYTPNWYSVSVYPTENGVSVFITDRTEEHEARVALREANARLEKRVYERTYELQEANEELKCAEEELRSQNDALEKGLAREKMLRTQLIQSEKYAALARLVGSVAHEINNPLQNVKNCLFLLRSETTPEGRDQILGLASSETRRMAELVVQLRQTYRPSNPQPVDFDLIEMLNRVTSLLGPQFKQNNVEWQVQTSMDCVMLHGILDQIQQVCINICLNAIEAVGAAGGQLEVAVTFPAGQRKVCISFHDSGPGIPKEHLNQIFEPFFTTKQKGTGLGLAICYEIIKNHSGEISVESQPGEGTTFTVSLPI